MTGGRPTDPDLLALLDDERLTLWASPGLLDDPDHLDLGPQAMVLSIIVQAGDDYPGADLVDLRIASLLENREDFLS